jgi:hypothetical protein
MKKGLCYWISTASFMCREVERGYVNWTREKLVLKKRKMEKKA